MDALYIYFYVGMQVFQNVQALWSVRISSGFPWGGLPILMDVIKISKNFDTLSVSTSSSLKIAVWRLKKFQRFA